MTGQTIMHMITIDSYAELNYHGNTIRIPGPYTIHRQRNLSHADKLASINLGV